jgi:hypothetical protein
MTRIFAACLLLAAALLGAPHAVADPEQHVPYCSGDQTPMDDNCRTMALREFAHGSGLDPD